MPQPFEFSRTTEWVPNPGPQSLLFDCPAELICYGGASGGGKVQPDSSLICTPFGWRQLGELRIGDKIVDPTCGRAVPVVGIYPQPPQDVYCVTFNDGSACECGLEHLWAYWLTSKRRRYDKRVSQTNAPLCREGTLFVNTTAELMRCMLKGDRPRIPLTAPIAFTKNGRTNRWLDPYLVGLYLGDGCAHSLAISTADKEVIEFLKTLGGHKIPSGDKYDWRLGTEAKARLRSWLHRHGLHLKRAWEKFIPEYIQTAGISYRRAVLQGLLDSDGWADDAGEIGFSSSSKALAKGVQRLAWSLGGWASIREKDTFYSYKGTNHQGRTAYVLRVKLPFPATFFRVARKANKLTSTCQSFSRRIVSIQKTRHERHLRCIAVGSAHGLYLTNDYAVTHNTDAAIVWAAHGHDIPGYHALVLRRTFKELERHIILRAQELFPEPVASYNSQLHTLTFPCKNGGVATVEFGFIETDRDIENFQGTPYTRIAVDESTQHSEYQIRNLFRFLRMPAGDLKCQMLLCTNPIGPGYGWHYQLFIRDRRPMTIYTNAVWPSDKRPLSQDMRFPIRTVFIPAKYSDNLVGMKKDPGYVSRLRTQEGTLADALLDGRWDTVQNIAITFLPSLHTCDPREIPPYAFRWMAIDWGKQDKACAVWLYTDERRVYAYRDYGVPGREIKPYAHRLMELSKGEPIAFAVLSHECFADKGLAGHLTQADEFREVFEKAEIPLVSSGRDPEGRLLLLREFLRTTPLAGNEPELDYNYWMKRMNEDPKAVEEYRQMVSNRSDADLPRLLVYRSGLVGGVSYGCPYLIDSLPLLMVDLKYPRLLARNQDDHGFDALTYGLKAYTGLSLLPAEIIYRRNLAGRMPESEFAAQLAMQEAERIADDLAGEYKPTPWPMEKARS